MARRSRIQRRTGIAIVLLAGWLCSAAKAQQLTVQDREILTTGTWSAAFPLKLDNDYQMYEYACHEGNTAIRNYIETSRYERRQKQTPSAGLR